MAEVTGADREKATEIAGWPAKNWTELRDAIAAALAEEREKARTPFLRLASDVKDGWSPSADRLADAIRRTAEESQ